jgi:hypothetical protein
MKGAIEDVHDTPRSSRESARNESWRDRVAAVICVVHLGG